jgi:hypothetical protein
MLLGLRLSIAGLLGQRIPAVAEEFVPAKTEIHFLWLDGPPMILGGPFDTPLDVGRKHPPIGSKAYASPQLRA